MPKPTPQEEAILEEVSQKTGISLYLSEHSVFGRPGDPELCGRWEDALDDLKKKGEGMLFEQLRDCLIRFNRTIV